MKYDNLQRKKWALVMAALFALSVPVALASDALIISGSYQVLKSRNIGSQALLQLQIHLVNRGTSDFSIQRMTLWDFSHADKGGTRACAVALRAHASADTTQEFSIRRSDYQLWQKGFRPRLVLQIAGPGRTKSKAAVRLDRISGPEAK